MKRSPLAVILFVSFVDLIGFGLIIPLQAVYAVRLNASGLVLGGLIGIYALMQFIFTPLLGHWSDRIGRRPVLLLSVGGSVLSHCLLGVGDLASSLPILFAARALDGITGANIACAQAYIADVTEGPDRARGMGLFGAAFGLGFILGPALAALLAWVGEMVSGPYGTSWPAFGAAAASLVSFIMVALYLPEPAKPSSDQTRAPQSATPGPAEVVAEMRNVRRLPRIVELLVIFVASTFAFVLLEATFVLLCERRFDASIQQVGLIFAYIGMIMVIVQGGLVGRLSRKFGEPAMMSVGPFLTATGFACLALLLELPSRSTAWVMLLVASLIIGVGRGISTPTTSALISRQTGAGRQGALLGLSQGLGYFARAVSPLVAGWLFDRHPSWPYIVGAALFIAIGLYSARIRRDQEAAIGWQPGDAG